MVAYDDDKGSPKRNKLKENGADPLTFSKRKEQ